MESSKVSPLRAAYHYFSSDVSNLLLTGTVACFLGKHLISRLGKDATTFPLIDTIEQIGKKSCLIYQSAFVAQSLVELSEIVLRPSGDMHEKTKGEFPREDNQYQLRIALKTASLIFKMFSSFFVIRKTLNGFGLPIKPFSQKAAYIAGGAGILAGFFDLYETECAKEDQKMDIKDCVDINQGRIPLDDKLKHLEDKELHREIVGKKRIYDQVYMLFGIVKKIIEMLPPLDESDFSKWRGQFFRSNQADLSGIVLTGMALTKFFRHVNCMATIQQMEKGDVLKEGEPK